MTALRALDLIDEKTADGAPRDDEARARAAGERREILVSCGLDLPHLDDGHRVTRVLEAGLREGLGELSSLAFPSDDDARRMRELPAFTEEHFGLARVRLFRDADDETKHAVVKHASDGLLREAYFIEKLGLAYGAKMVLLSDTTEERMLYALFSADEARHLALVTPWLDERHTRETKSPFHALLARVIEEGDRATMVFLIQVVLEGWGLVHYRGLVAGARDLALKTALRAVLADEARHHGSGHVLFTERGLTREARAFSMEILRTMLHMVRLGPASVLDAVDETFGGLSRVDKREVLRELDGPAHARQRLDVLKKLMGQAQSASLLDALDEEGLFSPMTVDEAVAALG